MNLFKREAVRGRLRTRADIPYPRILSLLRKAVSIAYALKSTLALLVLRQRHEIAAEKRIIAITNGPSDIYARLHLFNMNGPGVIGAGVPSAAGTVLEVVGLLSRLL
jgi:hypothetical protein